MSRAYFSTLLGISRHPRQEVFTVVAVSRASRRSAKEQYSLAGTLRHEPLPSVTVTLSADAARRQRGGVGRRLHGGWRALNGRLVVLTTWQPFQGPPHPS